MAVVTNTTNLATQNNTVLLFYSSGGQSCKMSPVGWIPSEGSRAKYVSLSFLASRGHTHSLAGGSFLHLWNNSYTFLFPFHSPFFLFLPSFIFLSINFFPSFPSLSLCLSLCLSLSLFLSDPQASIL